MYENVVFAILALCFIVLAQRERKHLIPFLTIIYRAAFIFSIVMAIYSSFSVAQTYTTFIYNASGVSTANSIYAYSNTLTTSANTLTIVIIFGVMMIFSIILEIVEETYNISETIGKRFTRGT